MVGTALAVTIYWLVAVAVLGMYFVRQCRSGSGSGPGPKPSPAESYPAYKKSTHMLIPFIL